VKSIAIGALCALGVGCGPAPSLEDGREPIFYADASVVDSNLPNPTATIDRPPFPLPTPPDNIAPDPFPLPDAGSDAVYPTPDVPCNFDCGTTYTLPWLQCMTIAESCQGNNEVNEHQPEQGCVSLCAATMYGCDMKCAGPTGAPGSPTCLGTCAANNQVCAETCVSQIGGL
jgi:hypothetical protein